MPSRHSLRQCLSLRVRVVSSHLIMEFFDCLSQSLCLCQRIVNRKRLRLCIQSGICGNVRLNNDGRNYSGMCVERVEHLLQRVYCILQNAFRRQGIPDASRERLDKLHGSWLRVVEVVKSVQTTGPLLRWKMESKTIIGMKGMGASYASDLKESINEQGLHWIWLRRWR